MTSNTDQSGSPSLLDSLQRFKKAYLKNLSSLSEPTSSDNTAAHSISSSDSDDDEESDSMQVNMKRKSGHHALSTSESENDSDSETTSRKKRNVHEKPDSENESKRLKIDTGSSGQNNKSTGSASSQKHRQSNLMSFWKKSNESENMNSSGSSNANKLCGAGEKDQLLKSIRENFNKAIDDGSGENNSIPTKNFYPPNNIVKKPIRPNIAEASMDDSRKANAHKATKKKKKKKKKKANSDDDDEDDDNDDDAMVDERVYNSDVDSDDEEVSQVVTGMKLKVLDFLNSASEEEINEIKYHMRKVRALFSIRPFKTWQELVDTCESNKEIGTGILNATQELLNARDVLSKLMTRCEVISERTKRVVESRENNIKTQPSILNPDMKLKNYQMVGLNWLSIMHDQGLNGILADEMGLGKTIQVISFLAYLKEQKLSKPNRPHLIVVPSSTIDNWINEFSKWCPDMVVCQYYGGIDDRRKMRIQWLKNGVDGIEVILATYSIVGGAPEDRKLFRLLKLHYVIFDEGHLLKNMSTQRYDVLFRINAENKLLLTGTPIQNSLLELMSLLVFVMPNMFGGKLSSIKYIFDKRDKAIVDKLKFDKENIAKAKKVMMPFILRRLKVDVLQDLPTKTSCIIECPMLESQEKQYQELLLEAKENARTEETFCNMSVMMQLRRLANHPLCLRYLISDEKVEEIAKLLAKNREYKEKDVEKITDDLLWKSDLELHQLVKRYKCPSKYLIPDSVFLQSGKFAKMDELLPDLKANNHRLLIFSQFVFILDLLEEYLRIRGHSYLRIDGTTPVMDRQQLIDEFNEDPSIFVFLLTTKSGGMGINLTSADTVIINDVDFNPYNDKQAEDRVHRMGQKREVKIIRLFSKGTIEEIIFKVAQEKARLGKDLTNDEENEDEDNKTMLNVLQSALALES